MNSSAQGSQVLLAEPFYSTESLI
ncbi:unnamed protein product [Acanthoscelides obtectus]|uniref:Uncharacterized protein n=1 Tax=Acanthoscelides obtectus TaxID=200917 RepID=A0A9P0P7X6_ACAOB|nr:unnamed protein product [Acanthoscelides obtectus]CAK1644649.1 hypothetical protein AOBTE_LOCUS13908 [Acanthoscelides obtectus]